MIDKNAHIEISDQTGSFYRRKMLSNNGLLSGIVLVAAIGLCSAVIADKINMYLLHVLIFSIIWAIFAIGWNLAAGFAGIKAFGHQAFFAIGAYSSSLLSIHLDLSPWVTMWVGAMIASVASLIVVTPVLRLRSTPQIAIVTLAFGEIVRILIENLRDFTGGDMGLIGIPPLPNINVPLIGEVLTYSQTDKVGYFFTAVALLVLVLSLAGGVMFSRYGMAMTAVRDAPEAAESLGVNGSAYRISIFALSAFIVGVSGAFFAHYLLILAPTDVASLSLMIMIISMTIVGGYGSFLGPLLGAFILTYISETSRFMYEYQMLIYGLLVIIAVRVAPGGIARLFSDRKVS
tara:strand:+ start:65 stop:1102 length:1038 start_codon:yes stop_codon:yes gene_type:complete